MQETLTLVIKPHSIVDIITNSSSELFVCQRGHSLKTVKEIFYGIAELYHRNANVFLFEVAGDEAAYPAGTIFVSVDFASFPWRGIQLLRNIFESDQREEI